MAVLTCLGCGARSRVRVIHGLPGPELIEQARRGEVAFAGCDPDAPPPLWLCDACERDEAMRRLLAEKKRQRIEEDLSEI